MIKSRLVALDGSEHANAAVEDAVWLAERLRATVTGLHVLDIVSIEGSFFHDVSGSLGGEPYLFFSSRRRHTRLQGDWSSDVCSSDLPTPGVLGKACGTLEWLYHKEKSTRVGTASGESSFHRGEERRLAAGAEGNKSRVLSGMRPTGRLHIGHYFGALANWVRLQRDPA